MRSPRISIPIAQSDLDVLKKHARRLGKTVSDLARDALRAWLKADTNVSQEMAKGRKPVSELDKSG